MTAAHSNGEGISPQPRARRLTDRGPAPTVRKPIQKRYGAKAKYTKAPGETAYERRRSSSA